MDRIRTPRSGHSSCTNQQKDSCKKQESSPATPFHFADAPSFSGWRLEDGQRSQGGKLWSSLHLLPGHRRVCCHDSQTDPGASGAAVEFSLRVWPSSHFLKVLTIKDKLGVHEESSFLSSPIWTHFVFTLVSHCNLQNVWRWDFAPQRVQDGTNQWRVRSRQWCPGQDRPPCRRDRQSAYQPAQQDIRLQSGQPAWCHHQSASRSSHRYRGHPSFSDFCFFSRQIGKICPNNWKALFFVEQEVVLLELLVPRLPDTTSLENLWKWLPECPAIATVTTSIHFDSCTTRNDSESFATLFAYISVVLSDEDTNQWRHGARSSWLRKQVHPSGEGRDWGLCKLRTSYPFFWVLCSFVQPSRPTKATKKKTTCTKEWPTAAKKLHVSISCLFTFREKEKWGLTFLRASLAAWRCPQWKSHHLQQQTRTSELYLETCCKSKEQDTLCLDVQDWRTNSHD